jgi:hypothetical protein
VRHSSFSRARAAPAYVDHHQQRAVAPVRGDRRRRDPLELFLERLDHRGAVYRRAVERFAGQQPPRRPPLHRRQQVGQVQVRGAPVVGDPDRRHQVQAQQRQVDQVIAGQRLVAQVGVHQAQAAEAPAPRADTPQLGQGDARGVAHEHVFDVAAPVDQDPDLALDLARHLAQIGAELAGRDLLRPQPPPVHALEGVFLARLEAGYVAGDGVQLRS